MTTLDEEIFIEADRKTARQFECSICSEIHLTNFVLLNGCGHVFGTSCINGVMFFLSAFTLIVF